MPNQDANEQGTRQDQHLLQPSELKITDMRMAVVCSNYDYPIIRIDTNQGVYGIGEVRDAGHNENALQFKSMLLGQNPCNVDMIFRAIKQFRRSGARGRRRLGHRDRAVGPGGQGLWRALLPVPGRQVPRQGAHLRRHARARRAHARGLCRARDGAQEDGAHLHQVRRHPCGAGRCARRAGRAPPPDVRVPDWGSAGARRAAGYGTRVTDKGIARMRRDRRRRARGGGLGYLAGIDHFGPLITVKDAIRLGNALEPYGLAWMEDIMPWWDVEGNSQVTEAINVPTLTGEDIYLWDGWREMIENARHRHHPARPADLRAACWRPRRSPTTPSATACPRCCTLPARPSPLWPTCTAPRPSPALSRWSTTASTCPSGRAW